MGRLKCYLDWIFRDKIPITKIGKMVRAVREGNIPVVQMEYEFDNFLNRNNIDYTILGETFRPAGILYKMKWSLYTSEKREFIESQIQRKEWIQIEGKIYKAADIYKYLTK